MGNCALPRPPPRRQLQMNKIIQSLAPQELTILRLIFEDLSSRIVERAVNLENFLHFFHKNGFWGERLFKEFDSDSSKLIWEEEFVNGIATIFKSSEDAKIALLFRFFANQREGSTEGIFFQELVTMLYNYPKEDLKEILNDQDFFNTELRRKLVSTEDGHRLDSIMPKKAVESGAGATYHLRLDENADPAFSSNQPHSRPSQLSKDILKNIRSQSRTQYDTTIEMKMGKDVYEVRTVNIQQLVKRFAVRIFNEAHIDTASGKMSFEKFKVWVLTHKKLYDNYFNGFHNEVWEFESIEKIPRYLKSSIEKRSQARMLSGQQLIKVQLLLLHSTIVVCEESDDKVPVGVVCLEGLSVTRLFLQNRGFGIEVTHRDGIYPARRFFFVNEALQKEWLELLKYYNGSTVQQLYDIGNKIGTGKFSVVYQCKEIATGRYYAIKVIEAFKLDLDARKLIAHESSIMNIVSHPLLVGYKGCIQTKTHIYIVTELVNGKDLFQFVKDYRFLSQQQAATIIQQIMVAIRYLHSLGIVHRDLKPENIMVEIKGDIVRKIKVIDFGFADYMSSLEMLPKEGKWGRQ